MEQKMTHEQMKWFLRGMDQSYSRLLADKERVTGEIRNLQEHDLILSWDEIASAVAYPKTLSDVDRVDSGGPDGDKLFHQMERINTIYRSQMADLIQELADAEEGIGIIRRIRRCIQRLCTEDRNVIESFIMQGLTYDQGAIKLHMSRPSLYKAEKVALDNLIEIYHSM